MSCYLTVLSGGEVDDAAAVVVAVEQRSESFIADASIRRATHMMYIFLTPYCRHLTLYLIPETKHHDLG